MSLSTTILWITGLAAVGYGLLAIAIAVLQRRLIYKPDVRRTTPEATGLAGVEVWTLEAPDGALIVAWYSPPEPGLPTVLYFHGNKGWIELRSERLAELKSRGLGVLMPSYRGYGGSTGQPSEAANLADAKLVYGHLLARGVQPADIVLFGESLGTGVAAQLAACRPARGLVLDSPYTSMTALARLRYPWLPVSILLRDRYETLSHLSGVEMPLLVIHGGKDELVPAAMGRAVYAAASGHKALAVFPDAGHLDHVSHGSFDAVAGWISALGEGPVDGSPVRASLVSRLPILAPDRGVPNWGAPSRGTSGATKRPEAVPQAYVVGKV